MVGKDSTPLIVVSGSISVHLVPRALRFANETLNFPENSSIKALDVDNGVAMEDWRSSRLGPCVALVIERQVLGEFPNTEK
ncbi:unnamed protein product, partial [Choristocarpus tenellus]